MGLVVIARVGGRQPVAAGAKRRRSDAAAPWRPEKYRVGGWGKKRELLATMGRCRRKRCIVRCVCVVLGELIAKRPWGLIAH